MLKPLILGKIAKVYKSRMNQERKIKNALISVFYKEGLEPIVQELNKLGVCFYSTGGTEEFINKLGIPVKKVEDLTSYPSILGGRVKTLHPKVFGGILNRREHEIDKEEIKKFEIPEIDLVIVDLYPFEETVNSKVSEEAIIEKIDIGGVSLIRAAAKNHKDVLIISDRKDYSQLLQLLKDKKGITYLEDRKLFAKKAFDVTSHYDSAIFNYFDESNPTSLKISESLKNPLRYGENPHQKASFYGDLESMFEKLNGKDLSYNNLVDVDACIQLIDEFDSPTFAIIKHTNACGVASATNLLAAWKMALAADPISAFGGVLICNGEIDEACAIEMNTLFFEVLIANSFSKEALEILKTKKNRILLKRNPVAFSQVQVKTLLNGYIVQDKDLKMETKSMMTTVTHQAPSLEEFADLEFANKLVKHTKSNTIILAKGGKLLASGVGQTSRVDALNQAILKAKTFGFDLKGAVMASDAFFPFPDCVEIAFNSGITAILQPGGSIKDKDSIDFCNLHKLSMVFTGIRHFKH